MTVNQEELHVVVQDIHRLSDDCENFWAAVRQQNVPNATFNFDPQDGYGLEIKVGNCTISLCLVRGQPMIFLERTNGHTVGEGGPVPRKHRADARRIYNYAAALATAA